jgi:hypothetical protein
MTEVVKKSDAQQLLSSLTGTGFEEMVYWIWVSREKFHVEKFFKAIEYAGPAQEGAENLAIAAAPKDPKTCKYHIVASWNLEDKDEIGIRIEYSVETKKHEREHEHEPYAEEFMGWLGGFFEHESSQAHIHASFHYPLESRQSKFPLPLKTSLEGDAEIDGISLRLPAAPKGASSMRLTQGAKRWYVEIIANRRIAFKEYSVYTDVQAFLSVVSSLLEEKR